MNAISTMLSMMFKVRVGTSAASTVVTTSMRKGHGATKEGHLHRIEVMLRSRILGQSAAEKLFYQTRFLPETDGDRINA